MTLFTTRNVLIVVLLWIVGVLTLYGTSGLKESFWTNLTPSSYEAEPMGASKSQFSGMLLSDNMTSPENCLKGSSYSSSGGCIKLTEEQKRLIITRGGNRTSESSNNSF